MKMERVLGGLYEGREYLQAMREAKEDFDAWVNTKRYNRVTTKEKYKKQRLEKLQSLLREFHVTP